VLEAVSFTDQLKGLSLATKLNMSKFLSMLKGGLTTENKASLVAYMHATYTPDECAEIMALFNKYRYLLTNK